MFHWVQGIPFENNQGAYDGLTLWEQIDGGVQFTATRKFLTAVPIVLYVYIKERKEKRGGCVCWIIKR